MSSTDRVAYIDKLLVRVLAPFTIELSPCLLSQLSTN